MSNYYSSSSIPLNPTLRSSTLNAVIVVPLLSTSIITTTNTTTNSSTTSSSSNNHHTTEEIRINYNTHSYKSFQALFSSLSDVNLERQQSSSNNNNHHQSSNNKSTTSNNLNRLALRRQNSKSNSKSNLTSTTSNSKNAKNAALAAIQAASAPSTEITIIIPNSNLTPPSEFNYDDTPLKSHDWTIGSQRLIFINGLQSVQGQDRYKSFTTKRNVPSHYGHFVDLYPCRGVSSIIGVLNLKDCLCQNDVKKAQEELQFWIHKFIPPLHYEKSFLGTGDVEKKHPIKLNISASMSMSNHDNTTLNDGSHHDNNNNRIDGRTTTTTSSSSTTTNPPGIRNTNSLDSSTSDDIISVVDEDDFHYSPMSPKHYVTNRLFLFDSFDDEHVTKYNIDIHNIGKSYIHNHNVQEVSSPQHHQNNQYLQLSPKDIVAFPPLTESHIMNLHLNVVVNDLAMSIFMMIEKRIRVIDGLTNYNDLKFGDTHEDIYNKSKKKYYTSRGSGSGGGSGSGNNNKYNNNNNNNNAEENDEGERSNVGALGAVLNLSFGSNDSDDKHNNNNIMTMDNHHRGGSGETINTMNAINANMLLDDDILQTHSDDDFYYSSSSIHKLTSDATTTSVSASSNSNSNSNNNSNHKKTKSTTTKMSLKDLAVSAVKALNKQSSNSSNNSNNNNNNTDDQCLLPPIEYELQTPLDSIILQTDDITAKDVEYIKQRNAARREKYTADLALLAGSVMDAYDRYTSAAAKLKALNDQLWYAVALEGLATSFVAMSDTGGHGADLYLESNFQYPEKVMEAALTLAAVVNVNEGNNNNSSLSTKVDKSKTTMPEAVMALLHQACDIISRHIKLSSIYSELLLKMAWYIGELEGLHLLCRWGEGFSGGECQGDDFDFAMTASMSDQQETRWQMTSVSKIDLKSLQQKGKLDALLCTNAVLQCRRFTEILHRTASNGGLDAFTRAGVGARCAQLCLKGVRVPQWCTDGYNDISSFRIQQFPRKAAFFSILAAESMSQCKVAGSQKCAAGFWAAASQLYSKEGNKFDGNMAYAWACLRATVLNGMSVHGGLMSSEVGT